MRSNKGFTLIELLAVIVILAIIALIATPTILGVIETAREGAASSSALGYIDAVEKQIMLDEFAATDAEKTGIKGKGSYAVSAIKNINIKGDAPVSGTVVIGTDGTVSTGTCLVVEVNGNNYNVHYDGKKATVNDTSCTAGTSASASAAA